MRVGKSTTYRGARGTQALKFALLTAPDRGDKTGLAEDGRKLSLTSDGCTGRTSTGVWDLCTRTASCRWQKGMQNEGCVSVRW